jgi:hypothetical protein
VVAVGVLALARRTATSGDDLEGVKR